MNKWKDNGENTGTASEVNAMTCAGETIEEAEALNLINRVSEDRRGLP